MHFISINTVYDSIQLSLIFLGPTCNVYQALSPPLEGPGNEASPAKWVWLGFCVVGRVVPEIVVHLT